jgi:hypothetical protein
MKPHDPEMLRGKEGRGTEDLQCNACHMDTNTEGDVPAPGVPDWRMPPADHKMPIQGLTPGQLVPPDKGPHSKWRAQNSAGFDQTHAGRRDRPMGMVARQ